MHHPWKVIRQLYGDVEAGRYWHQTQPFLVNNIFIVQQSMYDPSLLGYRSTFADQAIYTDDIFSGIRNHWGKRGKHHKDFQLK